MTPPRRFLTNVLALLFGIAAVGTGCAGDQRPRPSDTARPAPDTADTGVVADTVRDDSRDTTPPPDPRDTGDDRSPIDGTAWDINSESDGDADARPPLSLTTITPARGPTAGGTKFAVDGAGLTTDTTLYVGTREAEVDLVGSQLVGETPKAPGPGTVSVKAIDPETGRAAVDGGFTYTPSLTVATVEPDAVPTRGGFQITLRGSGFTDETRVSFDGTTALRHEYVDAGQLRVVVPPHQAGPADLRVTNRNETILQRDAITYAAPLAVESVRPAGGPTGGGTDVMIRGTGFETGMTIEFGGEPASIVALDDEQGTARVRSPTHASGLVDVSARTPDGDATIANDAFYYRGSEAGLHLAAVHPTSGGAGGGSKVKLVGAGLHTSNLDVEFGSKAGRVLDTGPGFAIVQTPAHSVGRVDVRVHADGETSTLPDGFEFVRDLAIDRVTPARGAVGGGTAITVEGTGFRDVSRVEVGGLPASYTVRDDRTLEVTTPAHSPGRVDIVVERGDDDTRLADAFTFTEALDVFGLSPARGAIAGNTYVLVRGRGFLDGSPTVTFGGDDAPSVEVLDAQTLAVRTPRHSAGRVPVTVERGDTSVRSPQPFTFFDPAVRDGGTAGGSIRGSVNVSVYADGGAPVEHAFVMLSTSPTDGPTGRTDANGQVTLSGPDVRGPRTITAAAAGYSTTTIQDIDAENITLFLTQLSMPPDPPDDGPDATDAGPSTRDAGPPPDVQSDADASSDGDPGGFDAGSSDDDPDDPDDPDDDLDPTPPPDRGPPVFHGQLTGLDKIGLPGPDERPMAIVYTTKKRMRSRNPDPGPDNRVYGDGPYRIRTRTGDLALVALGGLYNTKTQNFDLMRMGVKRYQHATEGGNYERDLELTIPLDETIVFKITDRPFHENGPSTSVIRPFLDFGVEGYFGELPNATGDTRLVRAEDYPALEDELAGVELAALGGAYTNRGGGRYGSPRSIVVHRGIPSTTATVDYPPLLGVPRMTTPESGDRPRGDVIGFDLTGRHRPDFFRVQLFDSAGNAVFDAFVPGSADRVRLPTFPDFSSRPAYLQLDPYPTGRYLVRMLAIRGTRASFEDFSYSDLSIFKWSAYAVNYQRIQL